MKKRKMNDGIVGGGYNLPLVNFWKVENEKLERAFLNFARDEEKRRRLRNEHTTKTQPLRI